MLEWGLLSAVLLLLLVVFLQKTLEVQGHAEVAAVRTTLAALRTAMTLEHIRSSHQTTASVAAAQRNPFNLLQQKPGNYQGEIGLAQAVAASPGWYFDQPCNCVGYATSNRRLLPDNMANRVLVFRVVLSAGPAQLVAMDFYSLQGQRVD